MAVRKSWLVFANNPSEKCWEHSPLHSGSESRARERRRRPIQEEFVHVVDRKGRCVERTGVREAAGSEESVFSHGTCSRAEDEISASGRCRHRCGVRAGLQAEALVPEGRRLLGPWQSEDDGWGCSNTYRGLGGTKAAPRVMPARSALLP